MATLVIKAGLDCMVPETQDRLIAPKISQFTHPEIPEIQIAGPNLVDTFVMNYDTSLVLANNVRQAVFNLARKAEDSVAEYNEGRKAVLQFVQSDRKTTAPYFVALRHFEHCLAHLRQAVDCAWVITNEKQFEPKDGSVVQRVAQLRDEVHHMRQVMERSPVKQETSFMLFVQQNGSASRDKEHDASATSNVPIWLTNSGIECSTVSVSFAELAKELLDLRADAQTCVNMKPSKKSKQDNPGSV